MEKSDRRGKKSSDSPKSEEPVPGPSKSPRKEESKKQSPTDSSSKSKKFTISPKVTPEKAKDSDSAKKSESPPKRKFSLFKSWKKPADDDKDDATVRKRSASTPSLKIPRFASMRKPDRKSKSTGCSPGDKIGKVLFRSASLTPSKRISAGQSTVEPAPDPATTSRSPVSKLFRRTKKFADLTGVTAQKEKSPTEMAVFRETGGDSGITDSSSKGSDAVAGKKKTPGPTSPPCSEPEKSLVAMKKKPDASNPRRYTGSVTMIKKAGLITPKKKAENPASTSVGAEKYPAEFSASASSGDKKFPSRFSSLRKTKDDREKPIRCLSLGKESYSPSKEKSKVTITKPILEKAKEDISTEKETGILVKPSMSRSPAKNEDDKTSESVREDLSASRFQAMMKKWGRRVRSPEEEDALVGTFFRSFTTHSIVPYSVKVIVLDVNLLVEKALMILMENHVDAAPLWDGTKMHHIGMLTITDLVEVLNVFYSDPSMMDENFDLAQLRIKDWRRITNRQDDFITIDSDSSLENAVRELCDRKIHRLPIYESSSQTVVGIVSHHRILSFFNQYPRTFVKEPFLGNSEFLKKTLSEHRIGTYENLATIQMTTTVCEAVRLFIERRVSSLPVLKDKKCIKIFAKSDLVELASNRMYENRNLTVGDTLERREKECEPLTCLLTDTLKAVMIKLAETMAYRLVVVDADEAFLGIISVSDMMSFLVFRDPGTVLPSVNEVLSRLRRRSSDTEDKSSARVELPMTDEVMHGADSPDALVASLAALSTADTVEESLEPAQSEDQEDYARVGDILVNHLEFHEQSLDEILENAETEVFQDSI